MLRPIGKGTNSWTTKSAGVGSGLCNVGLNTQTKVLQSLNPSTTYEYKMKAFYCGGTESSYSQLSQFTTEDPCPAMSNLSTQTFYFNPNKVRFSWDTTGIYTFARIVYRIDTSGSSWQNAGISFEIGTHCNPCAVFVGMPATIKQAARGGLPSLVHVLSTVGNHSNRWKRMRAAMMSS